jgi:hypothetical protein
MTIDGGGWMLILNYLHKAGTNPSVVVDTKFPLQGSTTLGGDESGTEYWGNASLFLMNKLSYTELRFYCTNSQFNNIIHFKTSLSSGLEYAKTGLGSFSGLSSNFTSLTGHSSNIPTDAYDYQSSQGHFALLTPFGKPNEGRVWSIKTPDEWKCGGQFAAGDRDTHHQVWVR